MTDTATIAISPISLAPSKVGLISRLNGFIFGAPDPVKANGGYRKMMRAREDISRTVSASARPIPVFQIDRKRAARNSTLPRIWISEPAGSMSQSCTSTRVFTSCYPNEADKGGIKALELAERCFAEGLNIRGDDPRGERIQCFQAAELLYMHSMSRGNLAACTRLGVLYRFDMCRGSYMKDALFTYGKHARMLSPEETAFRLFRKAAVRGDAEASVQLGEMLLSGDGCDKNEGAAFKFFKSAMRKCTGIAFEHMEHKILDEENRQRLHEVLAQDISNAANAGNAALCIARSLETGTGVRQSFTMARVWYEIAYEALSVSFDNGFWYSKRNRCKARHGYMRALQEISGKY